MTAAAAELASVPPLPTMTTTTAQQHPPPSPTTPPAVAVGAGLTPANVAVVLSTVPNGVLEPLTPTELQALILINNAPPEQPAAKTVELNEMVRNDLLGRKPDKPLRALLLIAKIVIATWSTRPKLLTTAQICERYNFDAADVERDISLPAFIWVAREVLKYVKFDNMTHFVVDDIVVPLSEPVGGRVVVTYPTGSGTQKIGTRMRYAVMDIESSTALMPQTAATASIVVGKKRKRIIWTDEEIEHRERMRQWIQLSWSQKADVLMHTRRTFMPPVWSLAARRSTK